MWREKREVVRWWRGEGERWWRGEGERGEGERGEGERGEGERGEGERGEGERRQTASSTLSQDCHGVETSVEEEKTQTRMGRGGEGTKERPHSSNRGGVYMHI